MKRSQFCIILMLFACLTRGAANQVKNIALNYSADDFKVVSLNGDTSCIISKTYELQSSMKAGEPYLPVIHTSVLLPADATVESVTVNKKSDKELATDVLLLNNQFPVAASDDFVMPENPWYEQKDYPSKVTYCGTTSIGSYRLARFNISPCGYEATTGTVTLSDFEVHLQLKPAANTAVLPHTAKRDLEFREQVMQQILNKEDLQIYYPEKAQVVNNIHSTSSIQSTNTGNDRYYIITTEDLASYFNNLKTWKEQKGLTVTIKTIEDIQQEFTGSSLEHKIKKYIYQEYKDYRDIADIYVLLGGDVELIPTAYCKVPLSSNNNYYDIVPTDLYYACFYGQYDIPVNDSRLDWDYDDYYGTRILNDSVSLINNVYVGRCSVKYYWNVNSFTSKVISYEQQSLGIPWTGKYLFVGASYNDFIINYGGQNRSDTDYYGTQLGSSILSQYNPTAIDYLFDTSSNLYTEKVYMSSSLSYNYLTAERLRNQINVGYTKASLLHQVSKGGYDYWNLTSSNTGDLYNASNLGSIVSDVYKIILSGANNTNAFDYEGANCMGEAFMNSGCATSVYIGCTKGTYLPAYYETQMEEMYGYAGPKYWYKFADRYFYHLLSLASLCDKHAGKIFARAREDMYLTAPTSIPYRYLAYSINMLGDPEMQLSTTVYTSPTSQNEPMEDIAKNIDSKDFDITGITVKDVTDNKLYPCYINSSDELVVSYQLAPNVNQAAIRIYDLNGRIIAEQTLSETNGQIEIAAQSWAKGTYVCMMTVDNKMIRAYKFVKK